MSAKPNSVKENPIPLIELGDGLGKDGEKQTIASLVVRALETSGFLLVTSPCIPLSMQRRVIDATKDIFNQADDSIISHPSDPKRYLMLEKLDELPTTCTSDQKKILDEYWKALEQVKQQLLQCISIGLNLDSDYFVKLHDQNRNALRLLHYYPESSTKDNNSTEGSEDPSIRCKAHSDYGSLTLLLTDGVGGLQALVDDKWTAVPHRRGTDCEYWISLEQLVARETESNLASCHCTSRNKKGI